MSTDFSRHVRNFNFYVLRRIYDSGKELWYTDISSLTLSPHTVVFLQPGLDEGLFHASKTTPLQASNRPYVYIICKKELLYSTEIGHLGKKEVA
jgi:hypothetical protein